MTEMQKGEVATESRRVEVGPASVDREPSPRTDLESRLTEHDDPCVVPPDAEAHVGVVARREELRELAFDRVDIMVIQRGHAGSV